MLIGLAAFSGKLFGFLVIVPVAITYLFIFHKKLYIPLALTVVGTVAGSLIYIAVFYGGDYQTMLSYYHEQTTGMYGTPTGFVSLYGFFMNLITYGGESGFFRLSPYLVSLAGLSSIVFLVSNKEYFEFREENIPVVFMASWLLMGMLMLSPFVYRPLRYALFLIMPLSAVCAWAVSGALAQKLRISTNKKLITIPLGFLIVLYMTMQIKMASVADKASLSTGQDFLFWAVIVSIVVTAAIFAVLFKLSDKWKTKILSGVFFVLLLATVIFQGHLIYRGLAEPGSSLRDMNREVAEMVGSDAVLTGPYAPAFTIDNKLKAVIYVFGLPDVEQNLFGEFPISHVAADVSNWRAAISKFPFLKDALRLSRFLVRDGTVDLYRVPGDTLPLTDYERCISDFNAGVYDSVLFYNEKFCKEYPDNLSAQFNLIINYITFGKIEVAVKGLETLANQYPKNFQVTAFEYQCYKFLANHLKNKEYDALAESYYDRTLNLNPVIKLPRK